MNLQEAKKLIECHPGQFYTYLLKRPNGIPFYVGKGNCKGFRIEAHVKEALRNKGVNKYKINVIRKIWEEGDQVEYEIVSFMNKEELAFDKEMELIAFYGRKDRKLGILTNMTDGGDGNCGGDGIKGQHHSEETKRKMSEAHKGKPAHNKGIPMAEEQRNKMSDALRGKKAWNKGVPMSEEMKKKISESLKGRKIWNKGLKGKQIAWNKGSKGAQVAWNKGQPCSEKKRTKISESLKKQYLLTDLRERISESHKYYTDEIKRRMSESHKGKKLSEETKGKMSIAQKERWGRIREIRLCHCSL